MTSRHFLARFASGAGREDGAEGLRAVLGRHGEAAAAALPGLELAWQDSKAGEPPGSPATLCILDGWVDGIDALALELRVEGAPEYVLARGYESFGEGLLGRLKGSFALLIWSRDERRGLVARDQLGGCAVFSCKLGGECLVASEVRDLLAATPRAADVDDVSLAHWLARRPLPDGRTLFAGIERLGAGRLLRVRGEKTSVHRWWEPVYKPPRDLNPEQAVSELRAGMSRAVEGALTRASSPGIMLSGGLDSGCVAGLTSRAGRDARGYAGVFPNHPQVDESERIRLLSRSLSLLDVREHSFRGGSALEAATRHFEAWRLPPSSPNWFVWEPLKALARADGVDVMLDGEGGDELFGCSPYLLADLLRTGHLLELIRQARAIPGMGSRPRLRRVARGLSHYALRGALPPMLHSRARALRSRSTHNGPPWLSSRAAGLLESASARDAWKRLEGPRWWAFLAFALVDGPDGMAAQDEVRRAAAMASLEVAHPWRDLDLVELVLSLPPELNFDAVHDRPLAREAMKGIVPDGVRLADEKPFFNVLLDETLQGPDGREVAAILTNPPEQVAWALGPTARDELRLAGGTRSLDAWRVATASLWARAVFG